jgi:hypothetical protein
MCHDRRPRDYGLEEEARNRLRQHEEGEAREEARRRVRGARSWRAGEREKKPLTEKVREVVSSIR